MIVRLRVQKYSPKMASQTMSTPSLYLTKLSRNLDLLPSHIWPQTWEIPLVICNLFQSFQYSWVVPECNWIPFRASKIYDCSHIPGSSSLSSFLPLPWWTLWIKLLTWFPFPFFLAILKIPQVLLKWGPLYIPNHCKFSTFALLDSHWWIFTLDSKVFKFINYKTYPNV